MSNQAMPKMDLSRCCDCQKSFTNGQEYYELYREKELVMCFCLNCYKLYTEEKKVWNK